MIWLNISDYYKFEILSNIFFILIRDEWKLEIKMIRWNFKLMETKYI